MNKLKSLYLGAIAFLLMASHGQVYAVEINWNGFLSVVGGQTVKNKYLDNGTKTSLVTDTATGGVYSDDLTFEPDTIFGLQGLANLGEDLMVTVQFTGAGGEDFDSNVRWAYFSYDLNESNTLQAGRMRLPFYKYSSSLDVGYTYNWIRPPMDIYFSFVDVYEGVKLLHNMPLGDWDSETQFFAGKGDKVSTLNNANIQFKNVLGITSEIHNDWLEFRATYSSLEVAVPGISWNGKSQSDGVGTTYLAASAGMHIGQGYIVSEIIKIINDEPTAADQGLGTKETDAWYISYSHKINSFTPHVTYSIKKDTNEDSILFGGKGVAPDIEVSSEAWTIGLRWDFHSNAALKADYIAKKETSDKKWTDIVGEVNTVDVFSMGVDILF